MSSEWFYQIMGEPVGPVSGDDLRMLVQRGTITRDTPVRMASNGNWVLAGRVQGLFVVLCQTSSTPPHSSAPIPPQDRVSDQDDAWGAGIRWMLAIGSTICILAIGFLVWFIAVRDTWEVDNMRRLSARLREADQIRESDPLTAYKTYDEVLKETQGHEITDRLFAESLAGAEKTRSALYQKVQDRIRAEQAEKRRLAEALCANISETTAS